MRESMIIGRKREIRQLERAYTDKKAHFITVYGRRRVGKTFLVREFFSEKECTFFHVTGVHKEKLAAQLENFARSMSKTFFAQGPLRELSNWKDAFDLLDREIAQRQGKIVLFFDELPWLATPRSNIMGQIDFFWNNRWSGMPNVILIVCGSSASWLLNNIIYHKGGLYNRTTTEIQLMPFDLHETAEFLLSKKIKLAHEQVLKLYMAVGGIPFYLDYAEKGYTIQQIIQQLFFDVRAPLKNEYRKLFESLFNTAEAYRELVEIVARKKDGLERSEIIKEAQFSTGGHLTRRLKSLCDAGFLKEFTPWGKQYQTYYKVIDEFCLFYLRWIKDENHTFDPDHWILQSRSPAYYAWAGYAFESVCMKHIYQISRALGIKTGIKIGSWKYIPSGNEDHGAQIDLVIERVDDGINLCEIKYTEKPFSIDKKYATELTHKVELFTKKEHSKKQVFLSMVSAGGLAKTMYSEELVSGVVTLDDLFRSLG